MLKLKTNLAMAFIALTALTVQAINCDAQVLSRSRAICGNNGGYTAGGYTDGSYTDGSYTDGAYTDGSYTDGAYTDGSYTDGAYTDGSDTDGGYTDGSYTDGGYISDEAIRTVSRHEYTSI